MDFSLTLLQEIISFIMGLAASIIAIYKYAEKKRLLPKYFEEEIEIIRADLDKTGQDIEILHTQVREALGNISIEEAAALISQAEIYRKNGYKERDALNLGLMLIKATEGK